MKAWSHGKAVKVQDIYATWQYKVQETKVEEISLPVLEDNVSLNHHIYECNFCQLYKIM